MSHKKISITIAVALSLAIVLSINIGSAANINQALSTLSINEEWSIMAHAAAGKSLNVDFLKNNTSGSATDLEKRILAITSQGGDPNTVVAALLSRFDGKQIGDSSLLNDDIFGILALVSAGQSGSVTATLRSRILNNQNSDGGFGFSIPGSSDSNTTAMAAAALAATGGAPSSAISYLNSSKDSTGGFGYTPGLAADGASTAWVIIGLRSASAGIPSESTNFLESLQSSDGSFKWKSTDSSGSGLITAYAVIALSGATMPIRQISSQPAPSPTPSPAPTPVPVPSPTPTPTPAPITSSNSSALPEFCRVRIYHSDFNFPPEGGKIATIDGKLYFIRDYLAGCGGSVAGISTSASTASAAPRPTSSLPDFCLVRIYHSDFNFPPEGGKIATIDGKLYFVRDYVAGCSGTSSNTNAPPIHSPNPTPALPPPPPPAQTPPVSAGQAGNQYSLNISAASQNIFSGNITTSANTVMDVLIVAANQNGFSYEIKNTSLGRYVYAIGGRQAAGSSGWQYRVNGISPSIGADHYQVKSGDQITWSYYTP